ncbi:hypothetical protein D3C78_1148980 [compost metagenome]
MEAAAAALVDAHLGALLGQQHQQAQGFRIGDVQIVAGQNAYLRRRQRRLGALQGFQQVGQQQAQAGGLDEGDRHVDAVRLVDGGAQVRQEGMLVAAGHQLAGRLVQ